MKKFLGIIVILTLALAGCSIFGPAIVDHSDTVEHYTGVMIYDFDQAGASGFWISNETTGVGEALSVTDNGGDVDFYYNDRDYASGAYFVSADGDSEVYYWGTDNTPKTTYFERITTDGDSAMTAPTNMTGISVVVEADAWYWVQFDNGYYAKMHITNYASPYDVVEFEYYYQTDETEFFGEEE